MVSLIVVLHHFMGRFKSFPKETMISSSDLVIDWALAYIMLQRSNLIAGRLALMVYGLFTYPPVLAILKITHVL